MEQEQREPARMTAAQRAAEAVQQRTAGRPANKTLIGGALGLGVVVAVVVLSMKILGAGVPSGGDTLTGEQERARTAAWSQALTNSGAGFALPQVQAASLRSAIASMGLPAAAAVSLERDVQAGAAGLAFLSLRDDYAEDGDVVTVQAGGYMATVSLLNAPTRLPIPVPPGGTMVTITGVHDGGGGITVEVQGAKIPPLRIGQTVTVPVVPAP